MWDVTKRGQSTIVILSKRDYGNTYLLKTAQKKSLKLSQDELKNNPEWPKVAPN
jgi:hypothetical protein